MDASARIELAAGVNYQSFGAGEDTVVLSVGTGYLYRCNGTATAVLDFVRDRPTWAELRARFASRFQLPAERAESDLSGFVDHLMAEGLLAKAG